jgi:AcrR family transcriptional regulator
MDFSEHEPYRARVRREHRARILQVAEHHLSRVGCERFTLELVAGPVGLARAALYRYVGSRTDLIEQVLAEAGARAIAHFDHATQLGPGASLGEALGAYARFTVDQTRRHHAATGNLQLAYPCCFRRCPCPFVRLDTVSPALLAQIQMAPLTRSVPASDLPHLAQLLLALLRDVLIDAHSVDATEFDRVVQLMAQLIDRGLASIETSDPQP